MGREQIKYFASSFIWGIIAKFLDAGIRFATIPLLLSYFGKENYGLITLAVAVNAYMGLLNMGVNTGAVKFFSQWLASGKYDLLHRVARTNVSFYLGISLINSLVLVVLAVWGENLFQVTTEEFITFRHLLYVLAIFSIINWVTFVFNQLLVADEKIGFTQQVLSARSIFELCAVGLTVWLNWSVGQYFFIHLLINASVIIPYWYVCHKRKLIDSIVPGFYWKDFGEVFKYGLAILAMGVFQYTAAQSRPLILGIFSNEGVGILSEYRIIEVFPLFIISLGGMLISIFLPKSAKIIQNNDRVKIEKLAYEGTKYTSVLVAMLCFPIMLVSKDLLTLYVGEEYSHLSVWLSLWVFSLTLFLHNSPVASLVLGTGKTKMLVYSSAIACIVSIIINVLFCNVWGVGSAVVGYLVYVIIQMLFYYLYFNNKILGLKSMKVFKSFIIPTGLCMLITLGIMFLNIEFESALTTLIIKLMVWGICYCILLQLVRIVDIKQLLLNKYKF